MAYVSHANCGWYHYGQGPGWAYFDSLNTKIKIELKDGVNLTNEQRVLLYKYYALELEQVEAHEKKKLEEPNNEQKQTS